MSKRASIYFEKEVLVIDFTKTLYKSAVFIDSFEKNGLEIKVKFRKRKFAHVCYDHPERNFIFSDVNPFDLSYINQALPEYVEVEESYWKTSWFKRVFVPERLRLKEGWVEFKPDERATEIVTTQYRIIN